jgi:hypothetical protein
MLTFLLELSNEVHVHQEMIRVVSILWQDDGRANLLPRMGIHINLVYAS